MYLLGLKIPFFRVSVTTESGRSLLVVRYHELFEMSRLFHIRIQVGKKTLQTIFSFNEPLAYYPSSHGCELAQFSCAMHSFFITLFISMDRVCIFFFANYLL